MRDGSGPGPGALPLLRCAVQGGPSVLRGWKMLDQHDPIATGHARGRISGVVVPDFAVAPGPAHEAEVSAGGARGGDDNQDGEQGNKATGHPIPPFCPPQISWSPNHFTASLGPINRHATADAWGLPRADGMGLSMTLAGAIVPA